LPRSGPRPALPACQQSMAVTGGFSTRNPFAAIPATLSSDISADMTPLGRLIEWLRRRKPTRDDGGPRIFPKGDGLERQPEVDPLDELLRIVGEADASEPRPRAKPTGAPHPSLRPFRPCGPICGLDKMPSHNPLKSLALFCYDGGDGGIRTLDTASRIHTFQACAFSRSATPPSRAPSRNAGASSGCPPRLRPAPPRTTRRGSPSPVRAPGSGRSRRAPPRPCPANRSAACRKGFRTEAGR
jgi:hypothetical protein